MVLVPRDTPGLEIVRNINIMNHHSPEGHCEVLFRNVRVPVGNLLGEEGGGFAHGPGSSRSWTHPPLHAHPSAPPSWLWS